MKQKYIVFGFGRYWVTDACFGGYLFKKRTYKRDGFGFVEFSERKIETLKRLGFKEY